MSAEEDGDGEDGRDLIGDVCMRADADYTELREESVFRPDRMLMLDGRTKKCAFNAAHQEHMASTFAIKASN